MDVVIKMTSDISKCNACVRVRVRVRVRVHVHVCVCVHVYRRKVKKEGIR